MLQLLTKTQEVALNAKKNKWISYIAHLLEYSPIKTKKHTSVRISSSHYSSNTNSLSISSLFFLLYMFIVNRKKILRPSQRSYKLREERKREKKMVS